MPPDIIYRLESVSEFVSPSTVSVIVIELQSAARMPVQVSPSELRKLRFKPDRVASMLPDRPAPEAVPLSRSPDWDSLNVIVTPSPETS